MRGLPSAVREKEWLLAYEEVEGRGNREAWIQRPKTEASGFSPTALSIG